MPWRLFLRLRVIRVPVVGLRQLTFDWHIALRSF
jgi:hypothetical protein